MDQKFKSQKVLDFKIMLRPIWAKRNEMPLNENNIREIVWTKGWISTLYGSISVFFIQRWNKMMDIQYSYYVRQKTPEQFVIWETQLQYKTHKY